MISHERLTWPHTLKEETCIEVLWWSLCLDYSWVANLYPALSCISINLAGISLFDWLKTHPRSLFLLGICLSKKFYNWIFLILKAWQIFYYVEDEQILRLASNDNLALKNLWHFISSSCEVKTCQFLYDVFLRWIQLQQSCNIWMIPFSLCIVVIQWLLLF